MAPQPKIDFWKQAGHLIVKERIVTSPLPTELLGAVALELFLGYMQQVIMPECTRGPVLFSEMTYSADRFALFIGAALRAESRYPSIRKSFMLVVPRLRTHP
jgi:hypothetical protein